MERDYLPRQSPEQKVAEALEDPLLRVHIAYRDRLTLDQLTDDQRQFIESGYSDILGWPSEDDGRSEDFAETHEYPSPKDFYLGVFDSHPGDGMNLNNFLAHFTAEDTAIEDLGRLTAVDNMENMYGRAPYLLRAKLIAPDLIAGLQQFAQSARREELMQVIDEKSPIITGLYAAYHLMGRLIVPNDREAQTRLTFPDHVSKMTYSPIVDAHVALCQ